MSGSYRTAVSTILDRLCDLQMLAYSGDSDNGVLTPRNAVCYPLHSQTTFPYWVNNSQGSTPYINPDVYLGRAELRIESLLIFGKASGDRHGTLQFNTILADAEVIQYFWSHTDLADRDAADSALHIPPPYLAPDGIDINGRGNSFYTATDGMTMIGVGFSFSIPINITNG